MSIKDLVSDIKRNGLLSSMPKLEELYQLAIEGDEKIASLEARCGALAAENAGLKKFCKDAAFDADYEAELGMERGGFTDALNNIKTPATDAFLAEVRAQGVEMLNTQFKKCTGMLYADSVVSTAEHFAAQLRKDRE